MLTTSGADVFKPNMQTRRLEELREALELEPPSAKQEINSPTPATSSDSAKVQPVPESVVVRFKPNFQVLKSPFVTAAICFFAVLITLLVLAPGPFGACEPGDGEVPGQTRHKALAGRCFQAALLAALLVAFVPYFISWKFKDWLNGQPEF